MWLIWTSFLYTSLWKISQLHSSSEVRRAVSWLFHPWLNPGAETMELVDGWSQSGSWRLSVKCRGRLGTEFGEVFFFSGWRSLGYSLDVFCFVFPFVLGKWLKIERREGDRVKFQQDLNYLWPCFHWRLFTRLWGPECSLLGWVQGIRRGECPRRGVSLWMNLPVCTSGNSIPEPSSQQAIQWKACFLDLETSEARRDNIYILFCMVLSIDALIGFLSFPLLLFFAKSMESTQASFFCFSNRYLSLKVVSASLVFTDV